MALQTHERYFSGIHEQLPDAPANSSKLGTGTKGFALDYPLIKTIFILLIILNRIIFLLDGIFLIFHIDSYRYLYL